MMALLLFLAVQPPSDLDRLQGQWVLVEAVVDGKSASVTEGASELWIRNDRYSLVQERKVAYRGKLTVNANKLELFLDDKPAVTWTWKIEGDTLTLTTEKVKQVFKKAPR